MNWEMSLQQGRADASEQREAWAEVKRLRAENRTLARIEKGEVWYWADDGEDHPESLGCPAIVEPEVIRRWVALEAKVERLREELERENMVDPRTW